MIKLLEELHMLNRVPLSDDMDKAMKIIQQEIPDMEIFEVPSGTECWTWIVPEKWIVHEAYISDGRKRIVDYQDHPLHLVAYSLPVDKWVSKDELLKHLHFAKSFMADGRYMVPENPDAIPWVNKYYDRDWGFCMQKSRLSELKGEKFYVKIDTEFVSGSIKIGDLTVTGEKEDMMVIVTNICHTAQVNDSISGLVVAVDVAKKLQKRRNQYTYKFLFLPETIGSIAYLSHNEHLIPRMKCGIFMEMVGHKNNFVLQYSKQGNTIIDRISEYVLKKEQDSYRTGNFREVLCNDEGVLNSPGVEIPTISLSRWPYPEYHTSADCPSIIFEDQLGEARDILLEITSTFDKNFFPLRKFKGPIFLSRYNLWVNWNESIEKKELSEKIQKIMMLLEGNISAVDIAVKLELKLEIVISFLNSLHKNGLIEKLNCPVRLLES